MCAVRRCYVGGHGVGGEEKYIAVAAGTQDHRVGGMAFHFPGDQVAHDNALGMAVHQYHVQHFAAGKHFDLAGAHLAHQCAVSPQQQLLTGLAPGVEGPGDLCAAKGAVVQQSAVIPGKGDALGHALVDDVVADLGQAIDIGLPGPKVASFDRIVEQPPDAVTVVGVVLWQR